jgi:ATP-binding cassette subfamily F protein 3
LRPLRQELERIDQRLPQLAQERTEMEAKLSTHLAPADIAECGRRLKAAVEETQRLEERWLELSAALEAAAQAA